MRRTLIGLLVSLLIATTAIAITRSSDVAGVEQHCLAEVLGQEADGQMVLSALQCTDSSRAELLAAHGVGEFIGTGELAAGARSGTLATHYDGIYAGSSLTITGNGCTGGWYEIPSNWDNRVSSTIAGFNSGCDRIRHYDGDGLTGGYRSTWPNGTLGSYDNRANSIWYEY